MFTLGLISGMEGKKMLPSLFADRVWVCVVLSCCRATCILRLDHANALGLQDYQLVDWIAEPVNTASCVVMVLLPLMFLATHEAPF